MRRRLIKQKEQYVLIQAFSNLNVPLSPLGVLLKCRFQLSRSGLGLRVSITNSLPGDAAEHQSER